MAKDLKKIFASTDELTRLQSNLDNWTKGSQMATISNGNLLRNISLLTGTVNNVSHKLGRELVGYTIVRQRAQAQIWDTQDTNIFKIKTLALNTDADVVVDLWVF